MKITRLGKNAPMIKGLSFLVVAVVCLFALNIYLAGSVEKIASNADTARDVVQQAQSWSNESDNSQQFSDERLSSATQLAQSYILFNTDESAMGAAAELSVAAQSLLSATEALKSNQDGAVIAAFALGAQGFSEKLSSWRDQKFRTLKLLQGAGIGLAIIMFGVFVFQFLRNNYQEDAAVAEAQNQTVEILATVNDGLFLLDSEHIIGAGYSSAAVDMFRREDFDGLALEDLLRNIVSPKTLELAMDFVELLWTDRVNENLIKDINPLNQVDVHFSDHEGNFENKYLSFDFNRVRFGGKSNAGYSKLLVTVTDITDRVELEKELEESQAQAQAQLDLLMSILHVEPTLLHDFLTGTDNQMEAINQALKEPSRDPAAFRDKLDRIYRCVHKVKGESAALGLATIEVKAHSFEDQLQELKEKSQLSGNDFLPLAISLDDLLSHMASVKDLIDRLGALKVSVTGDKDAVNQTVAMAANRETPKPITEKAIESEMDKTMAIQELLEGKKREAESKAAETSESDEVQQPEAIANAVTSPLEGMLVDLAEKVATGQNKSVKLTTKGLEDIPEDYRTLVKDVTVQCVRNAVVHGIETPEAREKAGKPQLGQVQVSFSAVDGGYDLTIADDGRGLVLNELKARAIEKGFLEPEQADDIAAAKVYGFIFRSGFSTAQKLDNDAGRGVGMDIVHAEVKERGGRIKLGTKPGAQTKFKIMLPATEERAAA